MRYTDKQIRGLAINFLRLHYRTADRLPGTQTQIVDTPHDYRGGRVGARLTYQRPSGAPFTALLVTVTAGRAEELLYHPDHKRLRYHALLAGLTLWGVLLWAGSRVLSLHLWQRAHDNAIVWGVAIAGCLLTIAIVYLLLRGLVRGYRRIPVVHELRQLPADAHWIAYDERLFDLTQGGETYLKELERQCIRDGLGVLAVAGDGVVRNLMSPRRTDLPGVITPLRQRLPDHTKLRPLYVSLAALLYLSGLWMQARYRPVVGVESRYAAPTLDELGVGECPPPGYVLTLGYYPDLPTAQERADALNRRHRLSVIVTEGSCLEATAAGYYLYLDAPLDTEGAANLAVRRYGELPGVYPEVFILK